MAIARCDYTNEKMEVGHKSCGWTLVKQYDRFNLWKNKRGIRECFFKNQKPNENTILSEL